MWDHPRMKIPVVQLYAPPQTVEPELPPLAPELHAAVLSAFLDTRSGWVAVLKDAELMHPNSHGGFEMPHPRILELLAAEMKVKLPGTPQWKGPTAPLAGLKESAASQPQAAVAS